MNSFCFLYPHPILFKKSDVKPSETLVRWVSTCTLLPLFFKPFFISLSLSLIHEYKRVEILLVYDIVRKLVISVCTKIQKGKQFHLHAVKKWRKRSVFLFIHIWNTVDLQQLKVSKDMWRGVPFIYGRYTKGVIFPSKMVRNWPQCTKLC